MKPLYNKKARYEFAILETWEAGMQLTGSEVKSIRSGRMKLDGAYVKILNGEAFLLHAEIPEYQGSSQKKYDARRTRKLLLKRKQLHELEMKATQKRLTIVPLSCYTTRGLVKLKIGLAKRKKEIDKRSLIRKRDLDRETNRTLRKK
jgi:SsrA-binding protein